VAVAVVVLGPALGPGAVFTLDAAFVPRIPVPAGIWGLGPELARRVPSGVVLAWASTVMGGALAGKAMMGLTLVVAFAGAARLTTSTTGTAGRIAPKLAGLLYALSPLFLTRVGAGQWTALTAFAVLPWALPALLEPSRSWARTFLWSAAMAATGSVGGTLALVVVVVGVGAERTRRALAGGAMVAAAQLPWVVAGLATAAGWPRPAGADVFATRADGPIGAAGLLAGHGFWRASTQVGGDSTLGTALLGVGLLGLAWMGARALPPPWRWRAAALAGLGWALALASAVPGVRDAYSAFTLTAIGAPFRESQRFLIFTLVWLAPAAALGAGRTAGEKGWFPSWTPLAATGLVAVVLAFDGLWGVGGQLRPVSVPAEWGVARRAIGRAPGTVLALPYHRYLDLPIAGNRRVINPLPDYLGGDVISSSDPEVGARYREVTDPREPAVMAAVRDGGDDVGVRLAEVGVRWIVLLHAADWRVNRSLAERPGLRVVLAGDSLDLLQVQEWTGPVVDTSGRPLALRSVIAPLQRLRPSTAAVWSHPAAPGWMRGLHVAAQTSSGLVRLPPGRGPVWFWPSIVVLGTDAATLVGVVLAWRRLPAQGAAPRSCIT